MQIHKKVGWNDFFRSFPFQMFQLINEHITYSSVRCMTITIIGLMNCRTQLSLVRYMLFIT